MGFFDREPLFGEHFKPGARFILHGAEYTGTIGTMHGDAERTVVDVTPLGADGNPIGNRDKYAVLGIGIANQAKRMVDGDLPATVVFVEEQTGTQGNTVKLFKQAEQPAGAPEEDKPAF